MPPRLPAAPLKPRSRRRTTNEDASPKPLSSPSSSVIVKASKAPTLADVERQLVAQLGPLAPDAKRRLARAELKRLKHCETVRQSRVRKKNQRQDLRAVSDGLESELSAALAAFRATHDWRSFDERFPRDVLHKLFVHSIYEVRGLRREHGALKDQLALFDTLGEQLQRLQTDFQIPRLVGARTSIGTVHFQELSLEDAGAIMVDSHTQALSFFESMRRRAAMETDETAKTMGWTQMQRITPEGRMQFNFTKRLETIGVEALVDKSWAMYCDFGLYHGIYASVQKLEILQRVNDNTLLIRRDLQDGPDAPIFRTIFLLFRIRLDDGYLICFRSHNPTVFVEDDDDPNVQWMDMFYWLMITEPPALTTDAAGPARAPGRGCDVTYGGNVLNHRSARFAARWKYQIAMALLRWESNTAAPLFAFYG